MATTPNGDASERTVVESRDPLLATVLNERFRIDEQLAAGGFGAIYRATDLRSNAEVALKVLHAKLARDPRIVARFRREGKMLSSLRNPHTVAAYELGEAPDGTLYIVMELLRGESLYQRSRRQRAMPWRRVVRIAQGVCESLAEAHALGVVHRDLKPSNIHLEPHAGDPEFVKVLDFGIAKIVRGNDAEHTQLTQAGQMIGTIDYMSPEQMVGGELTPRSDIYALGVVMYEMIAGCTPFADAQTATAILAAVLTRTPEPLSTHAEVPPALDLIIARCLERDPDHRYADINAFTAALATVVAPDAEPVTELPTDQYEQLTEATRVDVRNRRPSKPGPLKSDPAKSDIEPASLPGTQPLIDARGLRAKPPTRPPARPPTTNPPELEDPTSSHDLEDQGTMPQVRLDDPIARAMAAQKPVPVPPEHSALGSQSEIDVAAMSARRGSQAIPGQPRRLPHPAPPLHSSTGTRHPVLSTAQLPPGMPHGGAPGIPPTPSRASTHEPPSYDMEAATAYDTMVRRIIWIIVSLVALVIILLITR